MMGKINRIHVAIVALVLMIGISIAFMLMLVKPRKENIVKLEASIEVEETQARKKSQAEKNLASAKQAKAAAEARWNGILDAKMSSISVASTNQLAMFQLYYEVPQYAKQLTEAINANPDIQLSSGLAFSGFGWSPPSPRMEKCEFPQKGFSIRAKNFPALLKWFKETEKLPRVLALLGNSITISGASPWIQVSIPANVTIYYRGAKAGAIAEGASGAGAPAAGKSTRRPGRPPRRGPSRG